MALVLGATGCSLIFSYEDTPPGTTAPPPDVPPPPPCAAIATFATDLAPTRLWHVAPQGDDGADGSAEGPFATIDRAAEEVAPGEAIRLAPGVYSAGTYLDGLRGEDGAPIWIGGDPSAEDRPVLDGGQTAIQLIRPAYVVVHDLEIRDTESNGIDLGDGGEVDNPDAAHHVVVERVHVHDLGTDGDACVKLSGVNEFFVLECELAQCGASGFSNGVNLLGAQHGLIANNHIHDQITTGVAAAVGTNDVEIWANRFVNAGERPIALGNAGGVDLFRPPAVDDAPNATVKNLRATANLIVGGETSVAFGGCVQCLVANNTFVDPDRWLIRVLGGQTDEPPYDFLPAQQGRFINNIVFYRREGVIDAINLDENPDAVAIDTFDFSNNLWFAHDDPPASDPELPVGETSGIVGEDPMLDAAYAIGGASPAAAAGTALSEVRGDFGGYCYDDPPSIGAFEIP